MEADIDEGANLTRHPLNVDIDHNRHMVAQA
jgi:hypothetical protein